MWRKIISTREEPNTFFGRINLYFCPIRIKSIFFQTTKMHIFLTYFAKRNVRSHFLRKFLKALICDVMWLWEISTWRAEHSNYVPKSYHGCNLPCNWLTYTWKNIPRLKFSETPWCKCSKQIILMEMDTEHSSCSSLAERWKLFC